MNFTCNLPVNLVFGLGVSERIGKETVKYGRHALIVTGRTSAKKSGLLDRAVELLRAEGVGYTLFDRVEPNPLTSTVEEGAAMATEKGCDVVVALGGGSIMDAAKAIAFRVKNDGELLDYMYKRRSGTGALPVILVPTTCGTGSEGNSIAVLTEPVSQDKKGIRGPFGSVSLIDPKLMMTMPPRVLASVGFDALCHNMEAYFGSCHTPISDALALDGIARTARSLVRVYNNPGFIEGWEDITLASTYGGMTIGMSGVAAPHALEHPTSGKYNVTHGLGLAAVTPHCFDRSWSAAPERFGVISRLLGGNGSEDCADTIRALLDRLNIAVRLRDLGVREEGIGWLTDNCMAVGISNLVKNPAVFDRDTVEEIYKAAY